MLISTGKILKAEKQADGRLMVLARATSETVDKQGEVVKFEGALKAFDAWPGNIREMHDDKKAVGKAVEVMPSPEDRAIDVKFFVSAGAMDTQAKVLDGTLAGVSVGGDVLPNGRVTKMVDGKKVIILTDWTMHELSLVDNPANPDASIQIVKSVGGKAMPTEVLAKAEEAPPVSDAPPATIAAEPADPAEDEMGAVGLLEQIRALLIQLAAMEVSELPEEGTHCAHEILGLIDRVEYLKSAKAIAAAMETVSMSTKTGDVEKGMAGVEIDKAAKRGFSKIHKAAGELMKACDEFHKMFGEEPEPEAEATEAPEAEAENPEGKPEAKPKEEEKQAAKSVESGDISKSVEAAVEKATAGIAKSVASLTAEVERLRSLPKAGGPVRMMPAVAKSIGPSTTTESDELPEIVSKAMQAAGPNASPRDIQAAIALQMMKPKF